MPGAETASLDEARAAAEDAGYPVLLKARAGGGGKGMRLVESREALPDAYARASAEALGAFGDGRLYLEKAIAPARHVEVQVLCDADGGVVTLGERECSIQRRHQKLIEESPSPALDEVTRTAMEESVARAAVQIGYVNAGTFEFLLGPGVRVDTQLEDGAVIPPYYDSLAAKLVVWDEDRPAAIERCLRALGDFELAGVPTTRELALEVVGSEAFRSGLYSTSFLEEARLATVGVP